MNIQQPFDTLILGWGCAAVSRKPNQKIVTGFTFWTIVKTCKDYIEGANLQSTTQFGSQSPPGIPTWGWHCQAHHENTRLWRIDDRLCGYAGAIPVKISDTSGHWECWVSNLVVISWDIGIPTQKHDVVFDLSTIVHPGVRQINWEKNEPLESPVSLFWHCCKIFEVRQCLWTGGFFLTLDLYKGWVGDPLRSLKDAVLLFSNMKFGMEIWWRSRKL